jgi:hypothetical protein
MRVHPFRRREISSCLRPAAVLSFVVVIVVPGTERPVTGIQHGYEHFFTFGFVRFTFAPSLSTSAKLLRDWQRWCARP